MPLYCALGLQLLTAITPYRLTAQPSDTASARRVFEANIAAIQRRDRAAYLALYLDAPTFARNGPGGISLGFAPFAAQVDTVWPDSLIATDLRLVPVAPGVVYGSYRYRVTQAGLTTHGTSERVFIRTPRGWRIAVSTAFPAPPGTPPAPVVLSGATLIDGTGRSAVSDAVVVVRAGRIECAGARGSCRTPAGAEPVRDTVDLAGRWIIPGLVDAHVHYSQTGWVDGRPDFVDRRADHPYERVVAELERRPERFHRAFTCSGVTAVFDVGGYPWTWSLREAAERSTEAPHLAAAGPLLSTVDRPILNLPDTRQILYVPDDSAARAAVRAHLARRSDAIKVWYIRPQGADTTRLQEILRAVAGEARRHGARLIVHATGLWEATDALRAGADVLVHGVSDRPVDSTFIALARERQVIYTPTLTVSAGYRQVTTRRFRPSVPTDCVDPSVLARARATDTLAARTTPTPELVARAESAGLRQLRLAQSNLAAVHRAGVPVAMGTDAGNPLTLHGPSVYAEMEAMQEAGMSPLEVLISATRIGARAMGRDRDIGTLESGRIADLVVLDADPSVDIGNVRRIAYVMRGGAMTVPRLVRP